MTRDLSVILPCYRSADIAIESASRVTDALRAQKYDWELIVVDDGGGDFAADPWPGDPRIHLVRLLQNSGKGAAVCAGLARATGRARVFTDVDLPYGIEVIPILAELLLARGFHLVIGDRNLPGSSYHQHLTPARRFASEVSAFLVGRLVTGGFFDTQCGLKAIRGDVADLMLPLLRVRGFAFDVELIYTALLHRLDIKRIPVRLISNQTSTVKVLRDLARGAIDIGRIKLRQLTGHYHSAGLRELTRVEFAGLATSSAAPRVPT